MKQLIKTVLYFNLIGLVLQVGMWKNSVWWGMATSLTWGMVNVAGVVLLVGLIRQQRLPELLQKESH